MFLDELNAIFVHIPKTGGNFVSKWLRSYSSDNLVAFGHQDGFDRFEIRGKYTTHKHMTIQEYYDQIEQDDVGRMFVVACIRHPVDRALSFYYSPHRWFKIKGSSELKRKALNWVGRNVNLTSSDFYSITPVFDIEKFEELVSSMKSMTSFLLPSGESDTRADVIIRYERLKDDVERAAHMFGIAGPDNFRPLNKGHKMERSRELHRYKEEIDQIVTKYHKVDFEKFYSNYPSSMICG